MRKTRQVAEEKRDYDARMGPRLQKYVIFDKSQNIPTHCLELHRNNLYAEGEPMSKVRKAFVLKV